MTLGSFFDDVPRGMPGMALTFIYLDGRIEEFDSARAALLPFWWRAQVKEVSKPVGQARIVVMMRRLTDEMDVIRKVPVKAISMCVFEGGGHRRLSAEEAHAAYSTDPDTGRPLPSPTDERFVDFEGFGASAT